MKLNKRDFPNSQINILLASLVFVVFSFNLLQLDTVLCLPISEFSVLGVALSFE